MWFGPTRNLAFPKNLSIARCSDFRESPIVVTRRPDRSQPQCDTRGRARAGCSALSEHGGARVQGIPVCMQVIGTPLAEAMVFRVAHAYGQATDWCLGPPVIE